MKNLKIANNITNRNDEALIKYLQEISRLPMVSIDEEIELANIIKRGGESAERAKERLVNANLRFVVSVAKQYQHQGLSLIDLINEGNIGLMKAADRYDATRGFKFISYAVWWIRQSILQAICEHSRMVRLPQNATGMLSKLYQLIASFEQEFNRAPSIEEMADMTGLDEEKIRQALKADNVPMSIDTPLHDDDDNPMVDRLSVSEDRTDKHLDQESLNFDLDIVLRHVLNSRELTILKMFYGLNGPAKSLDEIGDVMDLTHERVRQIREKSIAKLRDSAYSHKLAKYLG